MIYSGSGGPTGTEPNNLQLLQRARLQTLRTEPGPAGSHSRKLGQDGVLIRSCRQNEEDVSAESAFRQCCHVFCLLHFSSADFNVSDQKTGFKTFVLFKQLSQKRMKISLVCIFSC